MVVQALLDALDTQGVYVVAWLGIDEDMLLLIRVLADKPLHDILLGSCHSEATWDMHIKACELTDNIDWLGTIGRRERLEVYQSLVVLEGLAYLHTVVVDILCCFDSRGGGDGDNTLWCSVYVARYDHRGLAGRRVYIN